VYRLIAYRNIRRPTILVFVEKGRTPVTVLYDPLCGWCYGATPNLRRLAVERSISLELVPTGLFSGQGARPLDERFAAHAWANDQRIKRLTGQRFTELYRSQVLADRNAKLDSGPATLALTAVAMTKPEAELDALEAIQRARFVDGRDITSSSVLVEVLGAVGLAAAGVRVAAPDAELRGAAEARTTGARDLLRAFGADGVPTVIAGDRAARRLIPSNLLFGTAEELIDHLEAA
jgi:putative protein-disulfide isomerase